MRADTKTVSIDASPEEVRTFLAEPANLPRWAVGFAKGIRKEDEGWIVTTEGGDVPLLIASDPVTGVVDFRMAPAPGVEAIAASRVLARGAGAEVVFTQFQGPGMPDHVFEKNVAAVIHELAVLKSILEVECPL